MTKYSDALRRKEIGGRIARLRAVRGLTQAQLGLNVGRDGQLVSKWERGEKAPGRESLPKLAEALGVGVEEILGHVRASTLPAYTADVGSWPALYVETIGEGLVLDGTARAVCNAALTQIGFKIDEKDPSPELLYALRDLVRGARGLTMIKGAKDGSNGRGHSGG